MYIFLIVSISSILIHLHGFQLFVLLPEFIEITNRINLQNTKEASARLVMVSRVFFKLPNLHILIKESSFTRNLVLWTFGKLLIVCSAKVNLLYLLYSMT